MKKWYGHFFIVFLAILFSGCASTVPVGRGNALKEVADRVVVYASPGSIAGLRLPGGVIAFKGIPYAKAPVGDLRFKPPEYPATWDSTFPAFHFGPSPLQAPDDMEPASLFFKSEDCLTLNIWTPDAGEGEKPVIVFIPGGGFIAGGTSNTWYNGESFARRGDVVFVTVNYRVGIPGALYLGARGGEEYAESANLHILDQVAALRWVKDNISAFGGDPDNVTLTGESAGSISVTTLMGVPAARGLFHRVIAQSGTCHLLRTKEEAEAVTELFFKRERIASVDELLAMSSDELSDVTRSFISWAATVGGSSYNLFFPCVDGVVIPLQPMEAIRGGACRDIPLLTGTNLDETRYWYFYIPALHIAAPVLFPGLLHEWLDLERSFIDGLPDAYRPICPGLSRGELHLAIADDGLLRVPHIRLAEAQAPHANVYMYLFSWKSPARGGSLGSCHGMEIPFLFNVLDHPDVLPMVGPDPPQELADTIQDVWISFASTDVPRHPSIPDWPVYDTVRRPTMVIDTIWNLEEDPMRETRKIWEGVLEELSGTGE